MKETESRGNPPSHPSRSQGTDESSRDVEPPTRGPGSHSNNPYLLEHSYGLGVLAQRDPVSIRLRVSNRVEAIPPPPESGGALGGPGIRQNMRGGGRTPPGVGPDTPVCAQRVLKTRPRRALFCVSLAESGRHSAENTALPGRLTHSLFVKGTDERQQPDEHALCNAPRWSEGKENRKAKHTVS